jgi:chemotaxis family two-component system sensor kinase Cph1
MQHIVDGTSHMQRLLNDLLAFSQIGGGALTRKMVSLERILEKIRSTLESDIKAKKAEITSKALPVVYGDEMQIFTLLQNLIGNSLKYCGNLPPQIHISARRRLHEWVVCVRDNGIGIDPQHSRTVFQIFQRLHLRDEYDGTGVGLAICEKIVERHGGRIWLESSCGEGAAFYFSLPPRPEDEYA